MGIKNKTFFCKKDYLFISINTFVKPLNILMSIIGVVIGVDLIIKSMHFFKAKFSYGVDLNAKQTFYMIFWMLFGLLFVSFAILEPYFLACISYKRNKNVKYAEYEFGEDEVNIKFTSSGISSEQQYKYFLMDKYYEKNNAVYIRVKIDKVVRFIVIHNDGYSEGNKEQLIKFLESRNISG